MSFTPLEHRSMDLPDGRKVSVDDLVNLYREEVKTPIPTRADISNDGSVSSLKLRVVWSSSDCYQLESNNLVRYYSVKAGRTAVIDVEKVSDPTDVNNILAFSKSPKSGKIAQIRSKKDAATGNDKQIIEILIDNFKSKSWDVDCFHTHGSIIMKPPFGSFSWSIDEKALVYVAEYKTPKSRSCFKFKAANQSKPCEKDTNDCEEDGEKVYIDDWGEALDSVVHPVICVLDVDTDDLRIIEMKGKSLGQPFFIGERHDKVGFVAWIEGPARLGLTYCTRPSLLYLYDLQTSKFHLLAGSETNPVAIRLPRVSKDQRKLIYFENSVQPLFKVSESSKVMLIEDVLSSPIISKELIGLNVNGFQDLKSIFVDSIPQDCWSQDGSTIVFGSTAFNTRKVLALNVATSKLTILPIPFIGSATVLSLNHDILVVTCSSMNRKPSLVVSRISTANIGELSWIPVGKESEENASLCYTIHKIPSEADGFPVYTLLIGPAGVSSSPCVVMPHGGPHYCFVNSYMRNALMLASLGFKSLLINYRGSTGFNEEYANSLPGFIGDLDVRDCVSAINYHVLHDQIKKNELVLWGGSHGGFLSAHISGQYSSEYNFKSCICRNPVTNLVGMIEATDVPDWIWIEGLKCGVSSFDCKGPTLSSGEMSRLMKLSPVYHLGKVRVPTLLILGKKDRRIPMSQGINYYKGLKAMGVDTKCLVYDDSHDLLKVDVDSDAFVNIMVWILNHW